MSTNEYMDKGDTTKQFVQGVNQVVSSAINKIGDFNKQGIMALTLFVVFLTIVAIVSISLYINWTLYKKADYGCKIITLVPSSLTSIDGSDIYNYPVNFYYIKTAYNCCSEGSYVNDYVNLCVLEKIITQGVRCFDFEIFNIDDIAVVSTSTNSNYWIKETFNYVVFSEALEKITGQAFNSLYCSNYSDPVFISLRMKTNNINVYNNLAKLFKNYTTPYLLEDKYSYGNNDNNFCGTVHLSVLMGKIVIMVNSPSTILQNSDLDEFVNINTGPSTQYFKYVPFSTIKTNYKDETILYTTEKAMFVSPDVENGNPTSPESTLCFTLGVQFIGMSFQNNDSNLQAYQSFFDKYKHAFIMKNEVLLPKRYNLKIDVPGEESDPNKCHEIKMGDKVISSFGTGCK